jgi:hypothetical protein
MLRPAAGIHVIDDGDVVYVARVPDGPIIVLSEIAGVIWREACDVERASVPRRVAEATAQPATTIRGDVERFIESLLREGLMTDE